MPQTKSRNGGRKNRGKKRGPGHPKPAPTADQIADSIETEIKKLQGFVDILRGKV